MAYKNHRDDKYCKGAGVRLQEGACGRGIGGADSLEWASGALNEDIWDDEEEEENALQDDGEIVRSSQEQVSKRNLKRGQEDICGLADVMGGEQNPVGGRYAKNFVALIENISASRQAAGFTEAAGMDWVFDWMSEVYRVYNGRKSLNKTVCSSLLDAGAFRGGKSVIWSIFSQYFVMAPLPVYLVEDKDDGHGGLSDLAADGVRMLSRVGVKGSKVKKTMLCYDLPSYHMPYCSIWTTALSLDLGQHIDRKYISNAVFDRPLEQVQSVIKNGYFGVFSGWSLQAIICKILYILLEDAAASGGVITTGQTVSLPLKTDSGYFNSKICESAAWNLGLNVLDDMERSFDEAQSRLSERDSQLIVQEPYRNPINLGMRLTDRSLQLGTQPQEDGSRLVGVAAAAWKYSMAATIQGFLNNFGGVLLIYVLGLFRQEYNYSLLPCADSILNSIKYRVVLDGKDVAGRKAEMMDAIQAFNTDGVKITAENFYNVWDTINSVRVIDNCTDTLREYTAKAVPAEMLYDAYMSGGTGDRKMKKLAESSPKDMADRLYEDIWDDEEEEENTVQSDDEIIQDARRNITERHVKDADSDITLLVQMLNSISITSYASDVYEYEINSAVVLSSAASAAPGIRVTRFSEDRGTGDVFQKDGLYYVDSARRLNRDTCGALLDAGLCRGNSVVVWEQGSNRNLMVMAPLPVQLVEDQDGGGSLTGMAADGVQWLSETNSLIAEGKIRRVILGRGVQREGVPYCTTGWMSALFCNIQNDSDINPDDIISGQPLKQKAFVAGGDAWSWWSVQRIACWVLHALAKMEAADPVLTGGMIKVELASDDEYFYSRIPGMPSHSSAVMNFCNNALNDTEETLHRMRELFGSAVRDDACAALVGRISMWDRRSRDKAAGLLVPAAKYGIVSAAEAALNAMMPAVLSDILKLFEDTYGYPLLNAGRAALENMRYKVILDGKDTAGWKDEMMSAVDAFNTEGIEITEYDVYDKSGTAIRKYTARAVPLEALYDAYMSGDPGKKDSKRTVESAAEAGGNILYDMADMLYEDIWDDEEEEELKAVSQSDEDIMKSAAAHTEERIRQMNRKILGLVPGLFGSGALKDSAVSARNILDAAEPAVSIFSNTDKSADIFASSVPGCLNMFNDDILKDHAVLLLEGGLCRGRAGRVVIMNDTEFGHGVGVMSPVPLSLAEDRHAGDLNGIADDAVRWLQWLCRANTKYGGKMVRCWMPRHGVPYPLCWLPTVMFDLDDPVSVEDADNFGDGTSAVMQDERGWWSLRGIAYSLVRSLLEAEAGHPASALQEIQVDLTSSKTYFSRNTHNLIQTPTFGDVMTFFRERAILIDAERVIGEAKRRMGLKDTDRLNGVLAIPEKEVLCSTLTLMKVMAPAAKYGIVSTVQAFLDSAGAAVLNAITDVFREKYGYSMLSIDPEEIRGIKYRITLDGMDAAGWKAQMDSETDRFNRSTVTVIEKCIKDQPARKYNVKLLPTEILYDAYISGTSDNTDPDKGKKETSAYVKTDECSEGQPCPADRLYEDIWDDEEEEEAAVENTAAADDETYSREALKGSGELSRKTRHRMLEQYSKEIDTSCGFYQNDENAVLTGVVDRCPYSVTASDKYNFFVQAQRMDSGTIIFDSRAGDLIIHNNESYGIKKFKMTPSVILSEITDETDNVRKKRVVYNDACYAIMPCTVMVAASPEECADNEFTKYARIHPEIDEYFDLPTVVPPACGIYPSTGCGLFSDAPANSTEHYGASFHNILREILLQAAMQDGKFCLDYIVPDWQMKFFSSGGSYRGFNILTEYTGSIIWCDTAFCRKYRLNPDSGSSMLKLIGALIGARQNLKAMHLLSSLLLYDIAVYMNRFADTVSDVLNTLADGNEDNLYYINSLVGGASVSGSFTVNGKTLDQCVADRDATLAEIRNNGLNLLINMDGQGTGPMHSKIYRFTAEPITADR